MLQIHTLQEMFEGKRPTGVSVELLAAGWIRGHWETSHELVDTLVSLSVEAAKEAVVYIAAHGTLPADALLAVAAMEDLHAAPYVRTTLTKFAETLAVPDKAHRHKYAAGWLAEELSPGTCGTSAHALTEIATTAIHLAAIAACIEDGTKLHHCGDHLADSPQCYVAKGVRDFYAKATPVPPEPAEPNDLSGTGLETSTPASDVIGIQTVSSYDSDQVAPPEEAPRMAVVA